MIRTDPLPDEWFSRDLPILREVARVLSTNIADPYARVDAAEVATTLGLDELTVAAVGGTLRDAGFVDGIEVNEAPGLIVFTRLTPAGRREVVLWPSPDTAADRLLAALDAAIETAPEGEQKSRLQRAREAFSGMTRDLLVDIAGGVIRGEISPW